MQMFLFFFIFEQNFVMYALYWLPTCSQKLETFAVFCSSVFILFFDMTAWFKALAQKLEFKKKTEKLCLRRYASNVN